MLLSEMKINQYMDELGSSSPAPGGGSASALCGAQGVALGAMVAHLTVGKAKYAEYEQVNLAAITALDELKSKLVQAIDKDTEAFNLVSAAFKMPKETDEQKAARRAAIKSGTVTATKVPLETLTLAVEGLKTCKTLIGKCNTNALSDIGVAALDLLACAKGAWLNVLINLGSLGEDDMANSFRISGSQLVGQAQELSDDIYETIISQL